MDPLLEIIPGDTQKRKKNLNRHSDLQTNIKIVEEEFIGKPKICHELVKQIIYLRRNVEVEKNTEIFFDLLNKYFDTLMTHYDLRWLLSVCDTIVDVGPKECRAAAMCVVITVNNLNVLETILDVAVDGTIDQKKLSGRAQNKKPTWDGMITCDRFSGDTIYNMQMRMNKVVEECEIVSKIWKEIKQRLKNIPEIPVNKLCSVHSVPIRRSYFV